MRRCVFGRFIHKWCSSVSTQKCVEDDVNIACLWLGLIRTLKEIRFFFVARDNIKLLTQIDASVLC